MIIHMQWIRRNNTTENMTGAKMILKSSNVLYGKVSSCDNMGLKSNAEHNYYDIR